MQKFEWVYLNEIIVLELAMQVEAIRSNIRKFQGQHIHLQITIGDHVPFFIYVGGEQGQFMQKIPVCMFECEFPDPPPTFQIEEALLLFKACEHELSDIAKVTLTDNKEYHDNPVISIVITPEQLCEYYEEDPNKVIAIS